MDTRTKPQKTKRQLVELYDKAMKHLQKKKLRKAKITFGKIMDIDPNYRDVATQLKNIQASSNNKFFDFLRDPLWQGIGGVVAIAAFVITVYTLLQGTSNPAATPTPATTALPTNTPTVSPVPPTETPSVIPYPTPVLISPDEGKLFTEEENVKLEWEWDQDLATNEFFEARIRLKGDLEFDALVPTKLSQDIVPASKLTQSGTYEWQVAIVLLTGEEKSVSPIRSFEMR